MKPLKPLPLIINEELLRRILTLSDAEYRVFTLMGEGLSYKEIAGIPHMVKSLKTIETHVAGIKLKLEERSQLKLYTLATRFNIYTNIYNLTVKTIRKPARTFFDKILTANNSPSKIHNPRCGNNL